MKLLQSQKQIVIASFAELDLTPQMAHTIHLVPREGVTMRALAHDLVCDASNATGIVDRLERRGLLERRPDDQDRRVKHVYLTPAGRRMREKIDERFLTAPPPIAALSAADQKTLRELLERALAYAEAERLEPGA